ncbi:2-C-methyl-D-erythritol 4-phosphate cytidylyltransferase [uncultured Rikenella sp.]|uniref:IspD/TarI family cytidylyltransferase n=1 Tax=uncultured Rikenella sp. TaxID=368003 RepID=UPI00261F5CA8|nr:2-C-methyl-D-erythritol 4-phosphate cytidylyltransferase [uncultured Rikenella sp.]
MILTIIVAAGSGTRMGAEQPKQFLPLSGEPIVMRTLRRMSEGVEKYLTDCSRNVDGIVENRMYVDNCVHKLILVLPQAYIPLWRELCEKHAFHLPHEIVPGGATRFHSVKNGLAAYPDAEIVLVHDGVRPFVDDAAIARVIAGAHEYGAAVPAVPVVDSLRRMTGSDGESVSADRSAYRAVQTPQGFQGNLLRAAYARPYDERFTDDASVVEASGLLPRGVVLTEGSPANIKITTPVDWAVAEVLLKTEFPGGAELPVT